MLLTRYEPHNLFGQFNHELNRLFTGQRTGNAITARRDWTPAADIREADQHYVLLADIPGVDREGVDITLEDGVLTVKGEEPVGLPKVIAVGVDFADAGNEALQAAREVGCATRWW